MGKIQRLLKSTFCIALVAASFGCAATAKHESTGQYVDDSVLTTKVKAAIFKEDTLKTLQINVKTYNGTVQLSGFVDSAQNVTRAGEVATRVENVISVRNDLVVK